MIIITGHLVVDSGERDDFVTAHRDLVARCRAFPGCIDVAICADPVDSGRVNNLEIWQDENALAAWRAVANAPDTGITIHDDQMRKLSAADAGPVFG